MKSFFLLLFWEHTLPGLTAVHVSKLVPSARTWARLTTLWTCNMPRSMQLHDMSLSLSSVTNPCFFFFFFFLFIKAWWTAWMSATARDRKNCHTVQAIFRQLKDTEKQYSLVLITKQWKLLYQAEDGPKPRAWSNITLQGFISRPE